MGHSRRQSSPPRVVVRLGRKVPRQGELPNATVGSFGARAAASAVAPASGGGAPRRLGQEGRRPFRGRRPRCPDSGSPGCRVLEAAQNPLRGPGRAAPGESWCQGPRALQQASPDPSEPGTGWAHGPLLGTGRRALGAQSGRGGRSRRGCSLLAPRAALSRWNSSPAPGRPPRRVPCALCQEAAGAVSGKGEAEEAGEESGAGQSRWRAGSGSRRRAARRAERQVSTSQWATATATPIPAWSCPSPAPTAPGPPFQEGGTPEEPPGQESEAPPRASPAPPGLPDFGVCEGGGCGGGGGR